MRVAQHRHRRRRRAAIAVAGVLVAAVGVLIVLNAQTDQTGSPAAKRAARAPRRAAEPAARRVRALLHLVAQKRGSLGAPLQDAAGASLGRGLVLLLGGLTAADTSTNAVHRVSATL